MDLTLREKTYCGDEERLTCLDAVSAMLRLAQTARTHGLLALQEAAGADSNHFLRKGLELILAGVDPNTIRAVLDNYITFTDYAGAKLLECLIIKDGLLFMQQGLNPALMKTALLSYFGVEGEALFASYKTQDSDARDDIVLNYHAQLRTVVPSAYVNTRLVKHLTTPPYCFPLLLKLEPTELARAMCCLDGGTQSQILAYLPYPRVKRIIDIINAIPEKGRERLAVLAQEGLLRSIETLAERGEVYIT